MENDQKNENPKAIDWQITVSQSLDIMNVKKMTIDMSKTRLKPVFLSSGDLVIIIPAVTEQAAREKSLSVARRIASDGTWGIDLLDFTNSDLD